MDMKNSPVMQADFTTGNVQNKLFPRRTGRWHGGASSYLWAGSIRNGKRKVFCCLLYVFFFDLTIFVGGRSRLPCTSRRPGVQSRSPIIDPAISSSKFGSACDQRDRRGSPAGTSYDPACTICHEDLTKLNTVTKTGRLVFLPFVKFVGRELLYRWTEKSAEERGTILSQRTVCDMKSYNFATDW